MTYINLKNSISDIKNKNAFKIDINQFKTSKPNQIKSNQNKTSIMSKSIVDEDYLPFWEKAMLFPLMDTVLVLVLLVTPTPWNSMSSN